MTDTLDTEELTDEDRKVLKAADLNKLDDSDFAYVDGNGDRHLPIHDAVHVRAALSRFNQTQFDTPADKKTAANKILSAAKKFGIEVDDGSAVAQAARSDETEDEERAQCSTCKGSGKIMDGHRKCPDCGGTGQRNAPTDADAEITALLKEADDVLDRLRAAQKADPDGNSDPDDKAVSKSLDKAAGAISKAKVAQASDNAPERSRRKPRHRARPLDPEFRRGIGRELRLYGSDNLEVRSSAMYGGNGVEIAGSPIVYNAPYSVMDMFGEFTETMRPGVASSVLEGVDCRFLFNHDGLPLARTTSGTLNLADTADALTFSAVLDTRQALANDLVIAIERGDVSQMSVGFVVADDEWSEDYTERSIYRFAELLDVSAVTYPASPTTSIDIAARMMMEVPVESRARIRKICSAIRSGRGISDASRLAVDEAIEAFQVVLDNEPEETRDGTTEAPEVYDLDAIVEAIKADPAPEVAHIPGSRAALKLERDLMRLRRTA